MSSTTPIMTRDELVQKQIDEIMDHFPFEKVHAQMVNENWTWGTYTVDGEPVIPSIPDLKKAARERLKSAAKHGYSSSGGFTATRDDGVDENGPWLRLSLVFGHQCDCEGETYV